MEKSSQSPRGSSRILSNIIYKIIYTAALIAVLPLFPSQAPNFMNHAIFTRGWEPLRLLVVGFAVSYGLFSRRSASETDTEKEPSSTTTANDNAESFISRFLQVSPVFDDKDPELPDGSSPEVEKMQAWSSRYQPKESDVIISGEKTNSAAANGSAKPLLLPIRSLKSCIKDNNSFFSSDEIEASSETDRVSRFVASPSTIPWRSRSVRMEVKEEHDSCHSRSSSFRSSSTKNIYTDLPSIIPELTTKSSVDLERKTKSYHLSSAIPPPPPPPPPFRHGRSPVVDPDERKKPFKDELRDASDSGRNRDEASLFNSRSVRTVRQKEAQLPSETKIIVSSDESCSAGDGSSGVSSSTECSDQDDSYRNEEEEGPCENEVDKKANEFIAKFREQIRLQRVESTRKRSTEKRRIKDWKHE